MYFTHTGICYIVKGGIYSWLRFYHNFTPVSIFCQYILLCSIAGVGENSIPIALSKALRARARALHYLPAFWPRGTSAAASRWYSPTYRWTAPSSRPSHAAAPPPSSTLPPAGRGRGCHERVKSSAPKGSDQGRGAPLCRVSVWRKGHLSHAASAVLARVCLPCAFLCGHRNLLVNSCSYSGVSNNHIRDLLNMSRTIGHPPTWRSNAFPGKFFSQANGHRASNARPWRVF